MKIKMWCGVFQPQTKSTDLTYCHSFNILAFESKCCVMVVITGKVAGVSEIGQGSAIPHCITFTIALVIKQY